MRRYDFTSSFFLLCLTRRITSAGSKEFVILSCGAVYVILLQILRERKTPFPLLLIFAAH
ncbi:hypothetical protein CLOSTMETH_00900 [[Clostridium] methylpentosum DSM 5476]|uniref:Uncharacterized protein n=1 Tax=[Clostridium] methylpentosum DSM 5476 TaxID=537013 RepID=C0EAN7_9FIRM|nr:hypothetical protein CLOSTMETH_00900 [[Clostridium] methylpentosum DSM 5476]